MRINLPENFDKAIEKVSSNARVSKETIINFLKGNFAAASWEKDWEKDKALQKRIVSHCGGTNNYDRLKSQAISETSLVHAEAA